ncbi:MAG TPA: TPM domain-containing protein, partial [Polyangia bacterium]
MAVALALAAAAVARPTAAQTFPALTGRVVDEAKVIDPPVRAAIEVELANLEARTTDQLVVVTVRSLQGLAIEDYGVRLGRQWQIGRKDKNNGVLLIVAPTERKVRIEVAYGLEGVLTDAQTKIIIESTITPRFRANDISGGIARGVDDIVRLLNGDTDAWQGVPPPRPKLFTRVMHGVGGFLSYMPIDVIFLVGLVLLGVL